MWDIIISVLLDALVDTLKILPFLLVMHILIEIYEYKTGSKKTTNKLLNGKYSPLLGAAAGLIPQCGFSVVATKLYARKNIRLGTLLAVYIATSDEAIPILLSTPSSALKLLPLLGIKFVFAVAAGFTVNLFLRNKELNVFSPEKELDAEKGCHGHEIGAHAHEHKPHVKESAKQKRFDYMRFIIHPFVHTLTILVFIFAVNFVLGIIVETLGEDKLIAAMDSAKFAQPFIAALIGLIPNCAGSVVIAQMYSVGGLTLGAAVAGLSVNAGIAYAVLFKENKNIKQNLLIVAGLYAASALTGLLIILISGISG